MNKEHRVNELIKRQMWTGSSMIVKLNSIDGYFFYTVWAWLDQGGTYTKFPVIVGKYLDQDPEDLITLALRELGIKKIKLGVPQ